MFPLVTTRGATDAFVLVAVRTVATRGGAIVVYVFSQDKGRREETCVGLLTQLSFSFKIDTAKCLCTKLY